MKGHEKLDQKMLYFLVYHYFLGHLAILKDVTFDVLINDVFFVGNTSFTIKI